MMHVLDGNPTSFNHIADLFFDRRQISLSDSCREQVQKCRSFLESKLDETDRQYYGINTGFGSLYNVEISSSAIEDLQSNLIKSHATGLGPPIDPNLCRFVLLLKIINLSLGHSGVRLKLLDRLIELYNRNLIPVMYTYGSLGASGDLAPLAHLSLPLIGLGQFYMNGDIVDAAQILDQENLAPLTLKSKEGLALINGTQFTTAITAWSLIETRQMWEASNLCGAISLDAFDCRPEPFDARIHQVRSHEGQQLVASKIRSWLEGSEILQQLKTHVQDPYAFRCIPQVHGATYQAIRHAEHILETEINSVTDNPILFPDSDAIISGGNFHAQPIALVADYLAIAVSELGSISERRTYQLVSGHRELPAYLIEDAGLHSGFMIVQYTAASIVNRNKILCTPASIDSIISSKGQEDHVSMGANAATKLKEVVDNTWDLLGIEFMVGMQALDLREGKSSQYVEDLKNEYRNQIPFLNEDRVMSQELKLTSAFIKSIKSLSLPSE